MFLMVTSVGFTPTASSPRGEREVGGGNRGAEDGLAPHVLWAPEYAGMLGIEALGLEDGLSGPGEHGDAGADSSVPTPMTLVP